MNKNVKILFLIFLLATATRLIYLETIKDTFEFDHPIVDSGHYDRVASEMAEGKLGEESMYKFHRLPLYHDFLAMIYKIDGHNIYLSRFIQAGMGAVSSCLIFLLAGGVFNRRVGIVAGIVSAFYWPFIAFGAKFLPVNPAILFGLLTVLAFHMFLSREKILWIFAAGIFLAFSSMVRPNELLLLPVFSLWVLLRFRKERGIPRASFYAAIFLLGFILTILPPTVKDYNTRKEVMPLQKNYAISVYFGTDLEIINIKPGSSWRKLMMEVLDEDLIEIKERNIYFLTKTKDYILDNPTGYLVNLMKKIYILWNYYEFSPRESINYFREKSNFLILPLFNFGSIAAFSILGMLLAWKTTRKKAAPLYIFVLVYEATLLLFMPLARYRLPVVPFLIIFASYGALEIFEAFRKKKKGTLIKYASLVIPLFILTNTNPFIDYLENFSRPDYHKGRAYLREDDTGNALISLQKALKKHPEDTDIYEALGDAYFKKNDLKRSEICYRKAVELESRFPEAINKLGVVYAREGRLKEAKALFKKVLSEFPVELVNAHINLGNCYRLEGKLTEAEKEYKRAVFLDPDNLQALNKLASLYDEIGETNEDAENIRQLYRTKLEKLKSS